ncbi:MAG: sialidase family protein [Caldilineaceae bacterium]
MRLLYSIFARPRAASLRQLTLLALLLAPVLAGALPPITMVGARFAYADPLPNYTSAVDFSEDPKALGYTDSRKIVRDSAGRLYIAYRKKYKLQYETAYHVFVARSTDDGATWQVLNQNQPIEQVGDFNQRVPAIAVDHNDVLHVIWYGCDARSAAEDENQIKYTRSVDHGVSWSPWQTISHVVGYGNQSMWQEHPVLFVDNRNTLYVAWEGRDQHYPDTSQIKFVKSTDGGASWSIWANIAPANYNHSRPTLVATQQGVLYVLAYGSMGGLQQILYTRSADNGLSWLSWRPVAPMAQEQRHVSVAVDAIDRLHAVWRQSTASFFTQHRTEQIYYATLTDRGWSRPERVSPDDQVVQTYPSITADEAGALWVTWQETGIEDRGTEEMPLTGAIYYAYSLSKGWSPPLLLADNHGEFFPSLRRLSPFDSGEEQSSPIDLVWLSRQGATLAIRFAHLMRPPVEAQGSGMAHTAFANDVGATGAAATVNPHLSYNASWFLPSKDLQRELQSMLMIVVCVSLYVMIKFVISRWLQDETW